MADDAALSQANRFRRSLATSPQRHARPPIRTVAMDEGNRASIRALKGNRQSEPRNGLNTGLATHGKTRGKGTVGHGRPRGSSPLTAGADAPTTASHNTRPPTSHAGLPPVAHNASANVVARAGFVEVGSETSFAAGVGAEVVERIYRLDRDHNAQGRGARQPICSASPMRMPSGPRT